MKSGAYPGSPEGMRISRRDFIASTAAAAAAAGGLSVNVHALAAESAAAGVSSSRPTAGTWPLVPHAAGQPHYLADFTSADASRQVFSNVWHESKWRVFPFVSEQCEGCMIVAGHNSECPEISFELPWSGWHALHVGLISVQGFSRIEIKLAEDNAWSIISDQPGVDWRFHSRSWGWYSTDSVKCYFWKYAELAQSRVFIRQSTISIPSNEPGSGATIRHPAWLAYIKAIPLSVVEVRELQDDRKDASTRRLIATHDATGTASALGWSSAEDIQRDLEPYRDSDFFRIDWEGGKGDLTHYPSRLGRMQTLAWQAGQYHIFEKQVAASYQTLEKQGIDPFRVALEQAHHLGLEFHASYRVSGFLYPPPRDERNTGGLFATHPEWRAISRNGRPAPRLSYAFAGVRRWVIALLEEMASYPVDGVTILYNRRPPVVEYEAPIVEAFQRDYGLDPLQLAETDERWLRHRAGFVTAFMRELRQAMERISERRGRRLQISAVVMGTKDSNLLYGLDLAEWIKQELVDWIIPYQSGADLDSDRQAFADSRDARYFLGLTKGQSCRFAPNLMPRVLMPRTYIQRATDLYQAGVEWLYFWDTYMRCDYSDSWSALRRLGHREDLVKWTQAGRPKPTVSERDALRRLGEWDLSYETPG